VYKSRIITAFLLKVQNNFRKFGRLNIQIKYDGCESMPRFTERISLSDDLKQVPIPELIKKAKQLVKRRNYAQGTTWNYNGRFNDLQRSATLFGTDMLSEEFITEHIEEGMHRSPKLACSCVQRKSLLNLVATAANTMPVFAYEKASVNIRDQYLRESLSAYGQYLRGKEMSDETIKSYLQTTTRFLLYLEKSKKHDLTKLTAVDILKFITDLGGDWSSRSMRIVPSHLKAYLQFEKSPCEALFLSSVRTPCKSKPICAMDPENVETLWEYVEGSDGDLRLKAVLAVLLSTGMRPVDIAKLEIDDIDWNNDSISFIQSKTGECMHIGLFPVMGSAIARYMTEQRPKGTGLKFIFLSKKAPYRKLSPSICAHILKEAFKKNGVEYVPDGLHCPRAVRRSLVSKMIAKGIPIQKAAASIGHVDEKSIDLYTELDVERMRSICLPIPAPMKGWCV